MGTLATLACLGGIGYYFYDKRRASGKPEARSGREISPRRLTAADLEQSFKPTGKTGELVFARSEDGSRQVTARWKEYAADGLVHLLVSFVHNKNELRLTEEISDHLTDKKYNWTHKAENLTAVCATEMIREVQRGGPYILRLLRDEWIAEKKQDARPGVALESAQVRFYLDGRRATYVRTAAVK